KKSCSSSSSVGFPKLEVVVPCGSKTENTDLTAPPLPEVSMPCSTTRIDGASLPCARALAKSNSCKSLNSSSKRVACFFKDLALPSKPGVARGSESAKLNGVDTRSLRASLTLNLLILSTLLRNDDAPAIFLLKGSWAGHNLITSRCSYSSVSETVPSKSSDSASCASSCSSSAASTCIGLSAARECATSSSTALIYAAATSVESSLASSTPSVTAVARSISSELYNNSQTATRIIARSTAGIRKSSQSCAKKRSIVASIVSNSSATPATITLV